MPFFAFYLSSLYVGDSNRGCSGGDGIRTFERRSRKSLAIIPALRQMLKPNIASVGSYMYHI